ncbi:flagellar P-ring protein [Verrucomicrobiota bacterium]|nr:flagellar P-ring protein [Verrucomicrobiota bacterium]
MRSRFPSAAGWLLALVLLGAQPCIAGSRVKDIAMIAGARENQLVGYGLVVGLAGDGDKNPTYTVQSLANLLQRHGVNVPATALTAKNVAAVMITAQIPAFKKSGAKIDVVISSIGDAKSLQGGVLLQSPLIGADGKVYAVAQGPITVGGISGGTEGGGGASVQKNHPTVGQIVGGALVEQEIPTQLVQERRLELLLREPDFTSSARMAEAINVKFPGSSKSIDSTTVRVSLPPGRDDDLVTFIALIEAIEVQPDIPARIIINERTGTIVATARVRISSCAVSHGNLTISIASTLDVSQPAPLSSGTTAITPRTDTKVNEQKSSLVPLPELPTVEKVAAAMNSLGVTPRDMMSIFLAMKQAGALHAELLLR